MAPLIHSEWLLMSVMHVINGIRLPVTALYQDMIWEQRGRVEMTASGCSSSSKFFIFFKNHGRKTGFKSGPLRSI